MTFMTLSQRVQLELGKRGPAEIRELNLDHSKSKCIEGLTDEYTNLEELSLVNVGIESLEGLPKLPSLKALEASKNNISSGFEALLNCPNLEEINLTGNKIGDIDVLSPLAKLPLLRHLDLFNCDVTKVENYRKKMFALLPNLKYLDGLDENNEEEPSGEDAVNGDAEANGNDDDEADESDEDDEEEEYGIEVLQKSGDLEDDDEEDYAPEGDEEAELDDYDDLEEEEDDDVEDTGANLSGAGVTGPRRPGTKRPFEAAAEVSNGESNDEVPAAKQKPADDNQVDN